MKYCYTSSDTTLKNIKEGGVGNNYPDFYKPNNLKTFLQRNVLNFPLVPHVILSSPNTVTKWNKHVGTLPAGNYRTIAQALRAMVWNKAT